MQMNQSRFPCRECGHVKVKDRRTRAVKGGFICGECLGIPLAGMDFRHAEERVLAHMSEWPGPCLGCTDPMECGSWAACFNRRETYSAAHERAAAIEHDIAILQLLFPGTL